MRNLLIISSLMISFFFVSNVNAQQGVNLNANDFAAKIKQLPNAPIIDVRTPQEFAQGHIKNARNINVSSEDFGQQISKFDKTKPVFVYCLSGSRSGYAASMMLNSGFKEIYNLAGGMMKWRAANLPETTDSKVSVSTGMSRAEYNALLNSDKLVLIDFYAEWCAPCRKMKPDLDAISTEMKDKVVVVRINADENKTLAKELKVDALPVLFLYKNKKQVWSKLGYATKAEIVKQLKR
ncbi:MAG: thioredoxin domain-containing protein [Bacteroidales bacterium]|nr:thioredoxin domain-containing protein [Bacteroidales bacterium]